MLKFWILAILLNFSIVSSCQINVKSTFSQRYSTRGRIPYSQILHSTASSADLCNRRNKDGQIYNHGNAKIYKYDKERCKCGILGTKSHCPKNMEFYFEGDNENGLYGFCDCKPRELYDGPQNLIYHPPTDQCYYTFSRGLCSSNKVVSFDKRRNKLICEYNPCHNSREGSFYINGRCSEISIKHEHAAHGSIPNALGYRKYCFEGSYLNIKGECQPGFEI